MHTQDAPAQSGVLLILTKWHRWYWALVPLLAIVAYITVLRIGFLADDFFQLIYGRTTGIDLGVLLFDKNVGFLRPVGTLLIYQVGWQLWGFNPFPYHIVGLLAHAGSSLILGLWLARVTGKNTLGWLAGTLFGVFPLHVEAVGWVGAQFDTFAVLFGLASLWTFTLWWCIGKRARWWLYPVSLLLFTLGVFTKESLFTFVPLFALSVWLATPPKSRRDWRNLGFAVLPFFAPIVLNMAIRFLKWGTLGGYTGARANYGEFIWDHFIIYGQRLLSPLNEAVFGKTAVSLVGTLATIALLAGLTWYGRSQWRLLLLAGAWVALSTMPVLNLALAGDDLQSTLLPVLNVPPNTDNLQQNRYLYLASAGYCVGVASLLYATVVSARRLRPLVTAAVGLLVLLSTVVCWLNLRPWHTATVQVSDLIHELLRVVPPQPRPNALVWYVEDVPYKYAGAPLLLSGLGLSRVVYNEQADYPNIERVSDATQAPIYSEKRDAFAIRFRYDDTSTRFRVDYASGVTSDTGPPSPATAGEDLAVWDFTRCEEDVLAEWQAIEADALCRPGEGLVVQPKSADPQLIGPTLQLDPHKSGANFVRLRVAALYPQPDRLETHVSEWFWRGPSTDFGGERTRSNRLSQDGAPHVYWTIIPAAEIQEAITGLRFDSANGNVQSEIRWIAVDMVK